MDLSARMYAAVDGAIAHLERQLAVVDARLTMLGDGGFDPDLAKAGAALTRAVKDVTSERRQLERHDKRMTATPEQRFAELVKYVRTLDPLQRAELASVLAELEQERA